MIINKARKGIKKRNGNPKKEKGEINYFLKNPRILVLKYPNPTSPTRINTPTIATIGMLD